MEVRNETMCCSLFCVEVCVRTYSDACNGEGEGREGLRW
jgi:hypothetical protein